MEGSRNVYVVGERLAKLLLKLMVGLVGEGTKYPTTSVVLTQSRSIPGMPSDEKSIEGLWRLVITGGKEYDLDILESRAAGILQGMTAVIVIGETVDVIPEGTLGKGGSSVSVVLGVKEGS